VNEETAVAMREGPQCRERGWSGAFGGAHPL